MYGFAKHPSNALFTKKLCAGCTGSCGGVLGMGEYVQLKGVAHLSKNMKLIQSAGMGRQADGWGEPGRQARKPGTSINEMRE